MWKTYSHWCNGKQELVLYPVDPFYVSIFLNHILFTYGKKGSVITAFYGIRWDHRVIGFDSPNSNFFVQLEFAWCQCLCQSETNKKEPIISEMINFLVKKLGGKKFRITRSTIFAYMFVGFFIIFTDRRITFSKYLKISESHLEILVPKSKTNQREGHIVYISQAS